MPSATLDTPVLASNLSQMNTAMLGVLRNESLGGNAGRVNLGGRCYSCAAANGYADPTSGRILAFGNVQDVRSDVKAGNAEFTLKVAFGGMRFFRIVQLFAKNEPDSTPLSPNAREVLEESVRRWNQASEERTHTMLKINGHKALIRQITLAGAIVIAGGVALAQTSAAIQQQPPTAPKPAQGAAMGPGMGQMMENEGQASAMMAERQQMMAQMNKMKAMDKKLDDLIATMDAARGTEKVDAIAAVVKELAAHRTQMQQSMANCPMMMMMTSPEPNASDTDHAAHHPEK